MKGNPVKIVMEVARGAKMQAREELQRLFDRLSPRQRLYVVCGLFALFVAVDVYYIVSGFAGKNNAHLDLQHIENIELKPVITLENDSSR